METIKARPLTLADFEDGTAVVGLDVYWRRSHAGDVTYDPATLVGVNPPSSWATGAPTSVRVESIYGAQTTYSCSGDCPDIWIPADEGEEIPLTPQYGASVTLSVTMPGLSAEEAKEALSAFMDTLSTGRVKSLYAKPLADRRVNVYEHNAGQKGRSIALNVLEGEAHTVHGFMSSVTEEVSREQVELNMALLRDSLGSDLDA